MNKVTRALATRPPNSLIAVAEARALLASCKSFDDVKKIRDQARAFETYLRQQKEAAGLQDDAAEIRVRAERRMGEMLAESKENGDRDAGAGGDRKSRSYDVTVIPTLADLGIHKMDAKRWQDIARVPEPDFERFISASRDKGAEITSKGAYSLARSLTREEKAPAPFHILIALGNFKDSIRKLASEWPESERIALPRALRDLADEMERSE